MAWSATVMSRGGDATPLAVVLMRDANTPLLLWICAAICAHFVFAEGGGEVARIHEDRSVLLRLAAEVRDKVRGSEQTFEVTTIEATPKPEATVAPAALLPPEKEKEKEKKRLEEEKKAEVVAKAPPKPEEPKKNRRQKRRREEGPAAPGDGHRQAHRRASTRPGRPERQPQCPLPGGAGQSCRRRDGRDPDGPRSRRSETQRPGATTPVLKTERGTAIEPKSPRVKSTAAISRGRPANAERSSKSKKSHPPPTPKLP